MEETIAELRRQLKEESKAREEAERLQGEAERRLQPNTDLIGKKFLFLQISHQNEWPARN